MSYKTKHFYEFEEFRLDVENSSLWRKGKLISISPKALKTLILLVEKRGEIVSRDELLEKVWKETFVEEGNINYTISLLRKTLENKELIRTISRRGYSFTATVKEISQNGKSSPEILTHEPKPSAEKRPFRWILVSVLLVSILFVPSFAYLWRGDKPATASQSENSEAMHAYTRGKMILAARNVENREEKAIEEFQKAITLDPTFALPYAGLAEGYNAIAVKTSYPQSLGNYAKAKVAAEKTLALDANLAEGYSIRGWLKRQADWDWQGAENDLRLAIQLDPNNATVHKRLSQLLSTLGRHDEALAEVKIAYKLDPINDYVLSARFPILEARREYTEALKESEQFLRENKGNNYAVRAHATFVYHKEDFAKVIELGEESLAKDSTKNAFAWFSLLAASYYKTGQFDKADEALRQLERLAQTDTKALYSLAMNYAELGRPNDAIQALQKCFEAHEERMAWLKVEPRFANLQNDLRFQKLLQKMNFR